MSSATAQKAPEMFDAHGDLIPAIGAIAPMEYVDTYKGWPMFNDFSGEILDNEPMKRLKACVPDLDNPGFFHRAFYEFTYYGAKVGDRRDAVAECKEFVDKFDYEQFKKELS